MQYAPFLNEQKETDSKSYYTLGFVKPNGIIYPVYGKEHLEDICKTLNAAQKLPAKEKLPLARRHSSSIPGNS